MNGRDVALATLFVTIGNVLYKSARKYFGK